MSVREGPVNQSAANKPLASQLMGDLQFGDYLEVARRRKWWIVLSTLAVFAAATAYSISSPNFYHSQTVILVDPQQVPPTYVTPTVTMSVTDRLSTIRQEVLSPTRLSTLVHDLGLYADSIRAGKEDAIIASMQKAISIEVADAGSQRLSAFKIGFTGRNPALVARVANELAKTVIRENLRVRQEQSNDTRDFLESELQDIKKQLEYKEAELGRIKTANVMDLPESKQYHLEKLSNLRMQLNASEDRVSRGQQQRVYLQSLLAGTSPTVDMDSGSGGAGSPYQSQIQKLEARLAELRARYGPGFPEVRKVQKQLDEAKAKAASEEGKAPALPPAEPPKAVQRTVKNPVIDAQLNKLDQELEEQTKLQKTLQEQIDFHASKLEREPIFEQRIASLMRDYDTLRAHYNHLLDKKIAADMAGELEDRQKGERFVVLDPAPVPTSPAGPRRILLSTAGLLVGLMVGIGLAVAVEMVDPSVRTDREATDIVGRPVLASIPQIVTAKLHRRNRLLGAGAVSATMILFAGVGVVASYLLRQIV